MSADKPVSLAERIRLLCQCEFMDEHCTCGAAALEAEAKALEEQVKDAGECIALDGCPHPATHCQDHALGYLKRVEALVEVLREAPEPPNFAGLANLGVDPWTWVEHYREWYESRAAALADEPRKEPHEAD